jgi:hypothetical protein
MAPTESCALDVADRGGATLEEVGRLLNISRQATCEIESAALAYIRGEPLDDEPELAAYQEFDSEGRVRAPRASVQTGLAAGILSAQMTPREEPAEDEAEGDVEQIERISFFAESDEADERVADSIWRMLAKKQGIKSQHSRQVTAYRKRLRDAEKAKGCT